jgi:hypothetical protein
MMLLINWKSNEAWMHHAWRGQLYLATYMMLTLSDSAKLIKLLRLRYTCTWRMCSVAYQGDGFNIEAVSAILAYK